MLIDLVLGIAVAMVFIGIGWFSRGATHAANPMFDPFVYMVISVPIVLFLSDTYLLHFGIFSDERALVLYACGIITYLIGSCMRRPDDKLVIWERNSERIDEEHWIHPITHYTHDGQQYLMVQNPGAILRSMIGLRDPLNMDLARPYYDTSVREDTTIISVKQDKVVPIALSYTTEITLDRWRCGSRKEDDGYGNTVRVPRYLWHPTVTQYTYLMAERVWDRPESFFFEQNAYDDAIRDGAINRANVTRLEIALKRSMFDGVVDHIKELMILDVDGPDLQHDIAAIVNAERRRRSGDGIPTTDDE